jgi:hypothetical protein
MPDLTAKRTLVKSPPELWSELSEVERLARHLGAFGEIKITKLEPEHTVAWEGEGASGTVSIEPSGWGTKVTLTAQLEGGTEAVELPGEAPVAKETVADERPAAETAAGEEVEHGPADEGLAGEGPLAVEPEPSALGKAAGKEVEHGPAGEGPVAVEPEPVAVEPEPAAVEPEHMAGEPERVTAEPSPPEPEPVVAEPLARESVAAQPAQPIQSKPRRKRGLLAWLFRPRSSAQVPEPPVATPSEPVVEPIAEEPAVDALPAGVAPGLEEPRAESQPEAGEEALVLVGDEPVMEDEPPLEDEGAAEDEAAAEEDVSAQDEAAATDHTAFATQDEASADDPLTLADQPAVSETAPVPLGAPHAGDPPLVGDPAPVGVEPEPSSVLDLEGAQAILDGALDALGSAHHRPFSRG